MVVDASLVGAGRDSSPLREAVDQALHDVALAVRLTVSWTGSAPTGKSVVHKAGAAPAGGCSPDGNNCAHESVEIERVLSAA